MVRPLWYVGCIYYHCVGTLTPNVKFWKKKFALCTTKTINILTLVLSEKKNSERKKNHSPPCKLNGRFLILAFLSRAWQTHSGLTRPEAFLHIKTRLFFYLTFVTNYHFRPVIINSHALLSSHHDTRFSGYFKHFLLFKKTQR
jgi:hypothetical protein